MKSNRCLDVSSELIIERCGPGIRLIKPNESSHSHNDTRYSLSQVFRLPLNIYLMNGESLLQKVNQSTAESCGYVSEGRAVGRSVRDVSIAQTAARIIANDRQIMESRSLNVSHESFLRLDDTDISAISIKLPWFNDRYEIIGIFGCSLLLEDGDYSAFADSLYQLIRTGLFAGSPTQMDSILPGLRCGDVYFDPCEADILYYLVRGQSAKQIAKVLGLSFRTIEHRLEKIKLKTACASKSELIEKFLPYFS